MAGKKGKKGQKGQKVKKDIPTPPVPTEPPNTVEDTRRAAALKREAEKPPPSEPAVLQKEAPKKPHQESPRAIRMLDRMTRQQQQDWIRAHQAREAQEAPPLPWKTGHNPEEKKLIERQYAKLVREAKARGDVKVLDHLKALPLALNPKHNLSPEKMDQTLLVLLMARAVVELCHALASMGNPSADMLHNAMVNTDGQIEKLKELGPQVRSIYSSALLYNGGNPIALVDKYWYGWF
jgi:hypothetical protein